MACNAIIDVENSQIVAKFIRGVVYLPGMPEPIPQDGQIVVEIPQTLSWQCVNSVSRDEQGNWIFGEDLELKERLYEMLRRTRDEYLCASDWTQLPDAPVDRQAWMVYRQALRDMPANTVDPAYPIWPEKPV